MSEEEINITIEANLKKTVEAILLEKGSSHTEIIVLLYEAVSRDGDIPLTLIKRPNAETLEAIKEVESGEVTKFENVEQMFESWRNELDY